MATNLNSQTRNKTEFKKNRARLLADNPPCHWCGINVATEADHVLSIIEGGGNSMDNLVPACKPCNARRGQRVKTERERHKTQHPQGFGEPNTHSVFFDEHTKPPQDIFRIFPNNDGLGLTGHNQPRLETTTHSGHQSAATEIGYFAKEVLGVDLMPWQLHVLHGITAKEENGDWLHRVNLVSVARQCGKTTMNAAYLGWFLSTQGKARGKPVTVITTAHKLDLATAFYTYLAPILKDRFGAEVSWSYGRQKLIMPDGSTWHVRAATPAAGHGYSCDLIIADEAFDISQAAIDEGLLPSQRAKKNPSFLMTSTAGTQESIAMLRWRDQGLRAIDSNEQTSLYFAEYSPPPTLDPMTPEAWAYANPALGHTLDLKTIEAEAETPNRAAFLRASVNLWQASTTAWLEPGVFEALATDQPAPPGGVLAIEIAVDESTYTAVRAVQVGNKTHVKIAFVARTVAELWAKVETEITLNPNLRLAIVPALENHCPPQHERRRTIVGYKELLKWTSAVRAMILENRITHNNENLLNSHVNRAVLIKHQGSVAVSSTRSPGPIEACRCMIWAAALASRPQLIGKPVIVSGLQ
jgi:hypothetical protein